MTLESAKTIYDNLKSLGLTRAQVRKILPSWWSPDAEKYPDGVAELCLLISRRLSLDVAALMSGKVAPRGLASSVSYKHRADAPVESLKAATYIATSLARVVFAAMSTPFRSVPSSPEDVVGVIREIGYGKVNLISLVESCWAFGVPVVPVTNLPVGVRKMDGAVISVDGRPAIIVSKKKSSRAWLSFIVAHELGHIGCGHFEESGSIIDVSLQEQATYQAESSSDRQEREADHFALSLFGGEEVEREISSWPSWLSAADLAVRARSFAVQQGTESGHIVLRYAFLSQKWPEAMTALRFLSEDADAESVMKTTLQKHLDFDLISEDLHDLVCNVTGIER